MSNLEMKVNALMRLVASEDGPSYDEAKAEVLRLMNGQQGEGATTQGGQITAEDKLTYLIEDILIDLGMPTNICGFNYSVEAIRLAVMDEGIMKDVTKRLYSAVAEKYNTTSSRVERAMRHGIERVWSCCDTETLFRYFGNSVDPSKGKTTNSQFVSRVARIVCRRLNGAA